MNYLAHRLNLDQCALVGVMLGISFDLISEKIENRRRNATAANASAINATPVAYDILRYWRQRLPDNCSQEDSEKQLLNALKDSGLKTLAKSLKKKFKKFRGQI